MRPIAAVVSFVALGLMLSQHAEGSGSQPAAAVPAQIVNDKGSPLGCLAIVGKPLAATCQPCPPLWLGGPTVRCLAVARYYADRSRSSQTKSGFPSPAGKLPRTGWLARCPGLPTLAMQSPGAQLADLVCGKP